MEKQQAIDAAKQYATEVNGSLAEYFVTENGAVYESAEDAMPIAIELSSGNPQITCVLAAELGQLPQLTTDEKKAELEKDLAEAVATKNQLETELQNCTVQKDRKALQTKIKNLDDKIEKINTDLNHIQ